MPDQYADLPSGFEVSSSPAQPVSAPPISDLPPGFQVVSAPKPPAPVSPGVQQFRDRLAGKKPEEGQPTGYMGIPPSDDWTVDLGEVAKGAYRNIRDFLSSTGPLVQNNPEYGGQIGAPPPTEQQVQQFTQATRKPLVPLSEGTKPGTVLHGIARGIDSLTTPQNAGIVAATGGLGTVMNAALTPVLGQAANTLLAGYFAVQMGSAAKEGVQQAYANYKKGDLPGMAEALGYTSVTAALAALGLKHTGESAIGFNREMTDAIDRHNENAGLAVATDALRHVGEEPQELNQPGIQPGGAPVGKQPVNARPAAPAPAPVSRPTPAPAPTAEPAAEPAPESLVGKEGAGPADSTSVTPQSTTPSDVPPGFEVVSPLIAKIGKVAETLHVPEEEATARQPSDIPEGFEVQAPNGDVEAVQSDDDELGRGRERGVSGTGAATPRRDSAGEETSVVVPGEDHEIGGRYEVRDLSELHASHNGLTFLADPGYAHHNERDYSKPENQQRVINQASEEKFNPRYLITDNPDATNGPPVIDENGHVLGGNSRAMTMQIVYGRDGQAAGAYRALLGKKAQNFGIDPASFAAMKHPVLVRVASDKDLAALPGGSKWAIRKTNVSGTAALSASERATADAGQLSPELKASIAQTIEDAGPGSTLKNALTGPRGTALANELIAKGFFSEQERPSLMDGKTGAVTQLAKDRISKALVGEFFHDSDQYQRFPASLKEKLERVAAPLATVAGDPHWDLLPKVREAVDLIEHAEAHDIRNLDDATAQKDMFGAAPKWSPEAVVIAKLIRDAKPNDVVAAFRKYVNSKEPTMFGESSPAEAFHEAMFARSLDHPMDPEGQQQQPGWNSVDPTYSFDQIYKNADWEKLPERHNRPARLRMNRQALDMVGNAIGHPGYSGVSTRAAGVFARELRKHADRLFADGKIGDEALARAHRLADVLRTMHGSSSIQYLSDSTRSIRDRADLLREELTHDEQARLGEDGTTAGHVDADAMRKHALWPKVRQALLQQNYRDNEDVLAAEAGAKLTAGLFWQLDLSRAEGIRLLAHYYRNLAAQHGAAKAAEVVAFADRLTRRALHDKLNRETPLSDQSSGRGVPGEGGGGQGGGTGSFGDFVRGLESGRRKGSGSEVQRDVSAGERSLFDDATNEQVASEAASDRDQLTGQRLTAQINSPLTREEQLRKLKASKSNPQSSFFEDTSSPQGSLFANGRSVTLGSGLGALQPYYEKHVAGKLEAGAKQAAEALKLAKDDILKVAAPAARGEAAEAASLSVRKNAAELQRSTDRAEAALRVAARYFETLPESERLEFMDAIEHGEAQETPELDQIAAVMREMLDSRREAIRALGTGKLRNFIENYFPHIWEKPELAKELSANYGKRPIEGAKGFLKQRSLETIGDGIAAGLKPISTNPVDLVLLKSREMDKYLMAHHILADLKSKGLLRYVDARDGEAPAGWRKIDDPVATVYGQSVQQITEYPNQGLWNGLDKVREALGLTHERGFEMRGPAVGYAYKGKDLIKTRHGSAEDVVAHEIGHQIDWLAGSGKKFVTEYPSKEMAERLHRLRRTERDKNTTPEQRSEARKELKDLADVIQDRKAFQKELRDLADLRQQPEAYRRKREEKMALLAELWVGARELFERTAPKVFALWKQFLDENPKLHALRDIEGNTEVTPISQPYDVGGMVIRGHWWAPEPAARILNNFLSPSLRDQSALIRGFFSASNLLNQAQLGFSGFHAIFTGLEAVTSKLALGVYQAAHGDIGKGLQSAALAPLATAATVRRGSAMLREWYSPGSEGPLLGQLVDAAVAAGGRAHMESFYRTHIAKKMMQAWREGNLFGAIWRAPFAAFEAPTQAIMGWLVPRLKMGAFADLAQYELERLPEGGSVEDAQAALAKAWDSIDNRFGQLVYDNLFWHKYTKDLAMLLVRSPGWNVGDIRELGGGYADSARFAAAAAKKLTGGGSDPEFTHRMSYVPAHLLIAATVGALLYYLWHGKAPEHLKDYFFPRDAKGKRWSPATYVKDEYNWATDPAHTAANKLNPLVSFAKAVLTNRDFRDKPIRNPRHSWPKEVEELAVYTLRQLEPIWFEQWVEKRGPKSFDDRILPELGVTRAPKSLDGHR